MKANMPFKTQPIRNMKTGMEDTKKRTPRLVNVKNYNLDALVEFALDNNYIEGDKYELACAVPSTPYSARSPATTKSSSE